MLYIHPPKKELGFSLPPDVCYSWGQSRFELASAGCQFYALMEDVQIGSISWQSQETAADRQLEERFNALVRKWKRETIHFSLIQQMVLHPAYQEIIGLGPKVIPLILSELRKEPDFWFWALRALTGEDPITEEMRGDLEAMTDAWLSWGHTHAYL